MSEEAAQEEQVTRTPLSEVLSSEADQKIIDDSQEPATELETPVSEPEAETGVSEETQKAAPPAETVKPEEQGFKQAMLDERGKRQDLQRQIDAMQAQQNQTEKPDAFVNPDEAIDYGNNEIRSEFEGRLLNMSEAQARLRHDDFDEMNDIFMNELAVQNPMLGQQALKAADPFEFVYQQAKNHKELDGINTLDDYKAKIETDMRAKLEAEYADKAKSDTNNAINAALPPSLSTATATGGNQTPTWGGPTSLSNILGK